MVESAEQQTTVDTTQEEVKISDLKANVATTGKKEIDIQVCNPIVREERLSKYIIYTVRGSDKLGEFDCLRRYHEFNTLRELLVNRWPGCYIPPLPEKKMTGNMNPVFIEDRRKSLETFLSQLTETPYLYYGEELQTFLKSTTPDIEKTLATLPKQTYEGIMDRFTTTFRELSGKELTNELIAKINSFYSFLRKVSAIFENFKRSSKSMLEAKKQYYDQFNHFTQNLMCDYEKTCLGEFAGQGEKSFVFNDASNEELISASTKIKANAKTESFELLHDLIRRESKEIKAFVQAVQQKEKYEQIKFKLQDKQKSDTAELQKLLAGKTTFKSILSRKSKDEDVTKLELQISQTTKDIESVGMLIDMIAIILGYLEVDKFKKNKVAMYFKMITDLAKAEEEALGDLQKYWDAVLANKNLHQ